jgi:hypothetical protein
MGDTATAYVAFGVVTEGQSLSWRLGSPAVPICTMAASERSAGVVPCMRCVPILWPSSRCTAIATTSHRD